MASALSLSDLQISPTLFLSLSLLICNPSCCERQSFGGGGGGGVGEAKGGGSERIEDGG